MASRQQAPSFGRVPSRYWIEAGRPGLRRFARRQCPALGHFLAKTSRWLAGPRAVAGAGNASRSSARIGATSGEKKKTRVAEPISRPAAGEALPVRASRRFLSPLRWAAEFSSSMSKRRPGRAADEFPRRNAPHRPRTTADGRKGCASRDDVNGVAGKGFGRSKACFRFRFPCR